MEFDIPEMPAFITERLPPAKSVAVSMRAIAEHMEDYGLDADKSESVALFIAHAVAILVGRGLDAETAIDVSVGLVAFSMLNFTLRNEAN